MGEERKEVRRLCREDTPYRMLLRNLLLLVFSFVTICANVVPSFLLDVGCCLSACFPALFCSFLPVPINLASLQYFYSSLSAFHFSRLVWRAADVCLPPSGKGRWLASKLEQRGDKRLRELRKASRNDERRGRA